MFRRQFMAGLALSYVPRYSKTNVQEQTKGWVTTYSDNEMRYHGSVLDSSGGMVSIVTEKSNNGGLKPYIYRIHKNGEVNSRLPLPATGGLNAAGITGKGDEDIIIIISGEENRDTRTIYSFDADNNLNELGEFSAPNPVDFWLKEAAGNIISIDMFGGTAESETVLRGVDTREAESNWSRSFSAVDRPEATTADKDGLIVGGKSISKDKGAWIVAIDPSGEVLWETEVKDTVLRVGTAAAIVDTSTVAVLGPYDQSNLSFRILLLKRSTGDLVDTIDVSPKDMPKDASDLQIKTAIANESEIITAEDNDTSKCTIRSIDLSGSVNWTYESEMPQSPCSPIDLYRHRGEYLISGWYGFHNNERVWSLRLDPTEIKTEALNSPANGNHTTISTSNTRSPERTEFDQTENTQKDDQGLPTTGSETTTSNAGPGFSVISIFAAVAAYKKIMDRRDY